MPSPPSCLTVRWVFVCYPRVARRASRVLLHINKTRGYNEPNVNSAFPEGKCDGIWEEHLLLVSRRLKRTTRVKQGSSPRRLASTSSTAWMIWRRYAVPGAQSTAPSPTDRTVDILFAFALSFARLTSTCHAFEAFDRWVYSGPRGQFDPSHPENDPSNIWNRFKYWCCQGLISRCSVALLLFRKFTKWNESSCSLEHLLNSGPALHSV